MDPVITHPASSEYAPYFGRYIDLVAGDIFRTLAAELDKTIALLSRLGEQRSLHRYAEGKWSIKEVVGHMIDTERIFVYRATRFARNDSTELAGFEENSYVTNANFDKVPFTSLLDEFSMVRRATIHFFRNLSQEAWDRKGVAGGNTMTVRAWAFAVAGHEMHHRSILQERYLLRRN